MGGGGGCCGHGRARGCIDGGYWAACFGVGGAWISCLVHNEMHSLDGEKGNRFGTILRYRALPLILQPISCGRAIGGAPFSSGRAHQQKAGMEEGSRRITFEENLECGTMSGCERCDNQFLEPARQ